MTSSNLSSSLSSTERDRLSRSVCPACGETLDSHDADTSTWMPRWCDLSQQEVRERIEAFQADVTAMSDNTRQDTAVQTAPAKRAGAPANDPWGELLADPAKAAEFTAQYRAEAEARMARLRAETPRESRSGRNLGSRFD